MMTYKEKLNNLFSTLRSEYYWNDLFNDMDGVVLDVMAVSKYGNRDVTTYVEAANSQEITLFVNSIINLNLNNWKEIKSNLDNELNFLTLSKEMQTKTGTVTNVGTNEKTQTNAGKAFNDLTFEDDEQKTDQSNQNTVTTFNTQITKSGGNNSSDIIRAIEKETKFRRQGYYEMILSNIIYYLTKRIY